MKTLISWFVKNPVAANLIMIVLFLGGIWGYNQFNREIIPQTTVNGMTVSVQWPGASPRDVNEQIITRVEEAVDGLDGIDYIESTAYEGGGNVNIRTKLGINYNEMLDKVTARVDGINNLPPDIFRPQVFRWDARQDIMYLALHGDVDRLTLQRAATDLRFKLTELTGLQLTEQVSKIPEQVTIEVSEDNLRRYNLTFSQVSQAISASSVNLSAGSVETQSGNLQLRARAQAYSKADFEQIIIRQSANGGAILLKDIATVIDGFDDVKFKAYFKGQPTAIFQVQSPDELDISKAGDEIKAFEEEINASLPPGLTFSIWFDGSGMFDSRMDLISSNAILGLLLVLLTLVMFLRPAVAVWVTIGIATAFAGALFVAPIFGVSLNMISLFAFLLVIGIVVDDAIVVGESVHLHNENGIGGERGAISGANMVAKPVYFAVITTILMFIPWMLLSGPVNAITSQISLIVTITLIFSLIESFFILPAHLRHLKPIEHDKISRVMQFQQKLADSLNAFARNIFRPFAAMLIKFRYYTLATFVGLFIFAVGLLQAGVAPSAFLPEVDGDMIQVSARFPEGTSFERIEQVRQQLDDGVAMLNENAKADFEVDYDLITAPGSMSDGRSVDAFLGLVEAGKRSHISTKDLSDKLEEYVGPVPDAYRVTYGFTQGGSGGSGGLRFGVASTNSDDLRVALLDLKAEMESYGAISRAWDGLESSAKELQISLLPGAQTLGITLQDVSRQVRSAFYGTEVQRIPRDGEDVRVMVRYPLSARENIDSLQSLRIRTNSGVEVPLFSVAEVTIAEGVSRIRRYDRKEVEYTGARVTGGQSKVAEIKADLEANFFPQWELRHPNANRIEVGDDQIQTTLVAELKLYLFIVLLGMYILLAIAFKSYAQPFLIIVAIPFAFVGMVFGGVVTGVPFGMFSLFGFCAAAGVAVNDNLVLIDYVNRLRAKGLGAYQAMLDACVARFRPILLTSVTTFIGVTPILFETSTQAEFLKPMVVALAFGVLFDFFLTLMLVPAMYGIGVDITRLFRGWWRGERQPGLGSSYDPEVVLALDDMDIGDSGVDGDSPDADDEPQAEPAPAE